RLAGGRPRQREDLPAVGRDLAILLEEVLPVLPVHVLVEREQHVLVRVVGDQRAVDVEGVDAAAGGEGHRDLLEVLVEGHLGQLDLDARMSLLELLDDLEDRLAARLAARDRQVLERELLLGRRPGGPATPGGRGRRPGDQAGEGATGHRHGVPLLSSARGSGPEAAGPAASARVTAGRKRRMKPGSSTVTATSTGPPRGGRMPAAIPGRRASVRP